MTLSLKNVFLAENIMSQHYGLDKDTPRNVYVPDTTQNKVIVHAAEDPMYEDNLSDVQKQLNQGEWEEPSEGEHEIDWGDFDPSSNKPRQSPPSQQRDESVFQDEDLHTEHGGCGCGEPAGPHLHRVGAPGGPNLGNTPPVTTDGDMGAVGDGEPRHVLYDTDVDPYEEGGVFGTGGPSKEGSVILQDHEAQTQAQERVAAEREEMWAKEAEDERRAHSREEERSGGYDRYASDWKGSGSVAESFGDFAGDEWLEIG